MHTLADWLPKKNPLSRTRILVGSDGERYHWKQTTNWGRAALKLINPHTSCAIAEVRSARSGTGLFSKDRRMALLIQPEATPMLDVIVLSFIILDQIRREQGLECSADAGLAAARIGSNAAVVC
ncbi:hypothetical protein C8Q80DRAFT_471013 [Daedaleopsis nitida]|nr:hypothetical protein C8Q80DRAFT_471013 [Daedaleopsis nitida]